MLPQPSNGFEWVQAAAGPALRSRDLDALAPHLFTTRTWQLGSRSAADPDRGWAQVADAVGVPRTRLTTVRQVHGATVVCAPPDAERGAWGDAPPDADVIVGQFGCGALAIQTADCVPILIADRAGRAVAAVHAGWRGLAAGAAAAGVRALVQRFAVEKRELVAAIGPAIGACCYQVGVEVRQAFARCRAGNADAWFSALPLEIAGNPPFAGVSKRVSVDRWFFDSWAAARAQLAAAGVPSDQIFCASLCTASHDEVFCSYRRDGAPAGRMAAVINGERR